MQVLLQEIAMGDLTYNIKRYFSFSKEELITLSLVSLCFGFVLAFRDWGITSFNLYYGLFNFMNALLIVFFSIIMRECTHKIWALSQGYTATIKSWKGGIFITLFIAFLTNGFLPFLAYGGVVINHLRLERLGKFRYWTNLMDHASISLSGPLANLILAIFFKALGAAGLNPVLMHKAMVINILLCLFNLIPLPPFDGGDIFYASRLVYIFFVGFALSLSAILYYTSLIWQAFFLAIVLGGIAWLYWGTKMEGMFGSNGGGGH